MTTTKKSKRSSKKSAKKSAKKAATSRGAKKKTKKKVAKKKPAKKKTKKKVAKKKVAKKKVAKKKTKKKVTKKKVAKKKTAKKPAKKTSKKKASKKTTRKKVSKKPAKKTSKKKASKKKTSKKTTKKKTVRRSRGGVARKPIKLRVGDPAPTFELESDDGKTYALNRLSGKRVVLYFYPRDNTPGCTTEACDFRDRIKDFESEKTVVLGVSGDSLESHAKFRKKYKLPFPLLSDPDYKISTLYGAYGDKKLYGKSLKGVIRSTYVIGKSGKLEAIHSPVRVKGHAEAVLKDLRS